MTTIKRHHLILIVPFYDARASKKKQLKVSLRKIVLYLHSVTILSNIIIVLLRLESIFTSNVVVVLRGCIVLRQIWTHGWWRRRWHCQLLFHLHIIWDALFVAAAVLLVVVRFFLIVVDVLLIIVRLLFITVRLFLVVMHVLLIVVDVLFVVVRLLLIIMGLLLVVGYFFIIVSILYVVVCFLLIVR